MKVLFDSFEVLEESRDLLKTMDSDTGACSTYLASISADTNWIYNSLLNGGSIESLIDEIESKINTSNSWLTLIRSNLINIQNEVTSSDTTLATLDGRFANGGNIESLIDGVEASLSSIDTSLSAGGTMESLVDQIEGFMEDGVELSVAGGSYSSSSTIVTATAGKDILVYAIVCACDNTSYPLPVTFRNASGGADVACCYIGTSSGTGILDTKIITFPGNRYVKFTTSVYVNFTATGSGRIFVYYREVDE